MNIIKHSGRHIVLSSFFFLIMGSISVLAQADDGMAPASGVAATVTGAAPASGVAAADLQHKYDYAVVNGTPITYNQYNAELMSLLKERYYHGRVNKEKADKVRKELTNTMIERVLLLQEAEKRGIKPDEAAVEKIVEKWDRRGKLKGAQRDKMISEIRDIEGKRSQVAQLKELLQNSVKEPTPEEVRAYYDKHLDLFTQPTQMRLSVILLPVDPSSPVSAWQAGYDKAKEIYDQLKNGADFAQMAQKVSGDKSADKGGDLGYLHHGMLPRGLEDKVDKFEPGVIIEPIKMLEGWSIFRLEDRIPPLVAPYDRSKERAGQLLVRDLKEHAVQDTVDQLRKSAKIEIYEKVMD